MTRHPPTRSSVDAVAEAMLRLAVLSGAGVAPRSAWDHLSAMSAAPRLAAAATAAAEGRDVAMALARSPDHVGRSRVVRTRGAGPDDEEPWRIFAATWWLAEATGAPVADALREMAGALRESAALRRTIAAALAGPRSTAHLVTALPVIGFAFSALLGLDTAGALFGTTAGLVCLVSGTGMLALAALWNRTLVRRATPATVLPGLGIDLTAVAVLSGGPLDGARSIAESAAERFVLPDDSADRIAGILRLSRSAGVPAAELLRSEARLARSLARAAGEATAARLSVRLLLPLGLCILPAFMLLAVAPMMIALLSSTVVML